MGLGPAQVDEGDLVALIYGVSAPVILREVSSSPGTPSRYLLVGDCYVYGLMHGETLELGEEGDIVLV